MFLYGRKIISALSVVIIGLALFSAPRHVYSINEPYIYTERSISADTPLWEEYKISKEILSKMTTAALIRTLCSFPYWQHMEAMDSGEHSSLDSFIANYDVVQELCKRQDKAKYAEAIVQALNGEQLSLCSGNIAVGKAAQFILTHD